MDRTHKAQLGRMALLAKIKKAGGKAADAAKNVKRAKEQAKFREEIIERIVESTGYSAPITNRLRKDSQKLGRTVQDFRTHRRIKKLEKNQRGS
jgi:hypothetical protein